MGDHPWLGPVVSRSLRAVVRRDPLESCSTCSGNGGYTDEYYDDHDCPCGEDSYDTPTPADLLTDPRVQALVAALRRVQGDYSIEEEEGRCVDEALAPFEEVTRG